MLFEFVVPGFSWLFAAFCLDLRVVCLCVLFAFLFWGFCF